ncbi:hypothetical protein BYT27DRAFT_7235587 [Phlegmacium glaucopus]|nr:hypothetical protein BYT27DRAFT_7235587 [Phlegmacium glaucopus]
MPTAMAVAEENAQRQILLDIAPGILTNGMTDLSEMEIVAKANMGLKLMITDGDEREMERPEGTTFVGARKLRYGGVLLQMSTKAAAEWLKSRETRDRFLAQMGGTSVVKDRAIQTVVEYIPTSFDPASAGATQVIERASGITVGAIVSAVFIKPVHKRTPGQRTAHAIIGFRDRKNANHAIRYGLFIEGKHVWARKLLPEPKRCYKCQVIGATHNAAACTAENDTCAICSGPHRTSACESTSDDDHRCANCQAEGHGAADRNCPKLQDAIRRSGRCME